ncbi:MAG: AraC family transcriptional regulator [Clostridia bacterium]|nr:AraC family transcriptional regulator [Clostridia bacterium]
MKLISHQKILQQSSIGLRIHFETEVKVHMHDFFEFVYVCGGKAEHIFENKTVIVQKGDYFLINPLHPHEYRKLGTDPEFCIINCMFLPAFLDPTLADAKDFTAVLAYYLSDCDLRGDSEAPTQTIFHDDSGWIGNLIHTMLREFDEKKIGHLDVLRHLLVTLLIQLARTKSTDNHDPSQKILRYIKSYVDENYASPLLLSDICNTLNYSLPHVSSVFRKECGMTFRDYLVRVRIEKSCHLLRTTNQTIQEIALSVGYTDPGFFYKTFHREMDMTPDQYRHLH